ncbi:MAG TPA: hypothetical protein VHG51_14990 [Longimicrobiaceae bacterium]|nr:hypothetical protein [Longimicrobiaceae bacterium]
MRTTLLVHVVGGTIGIVSGFVALYALKGGRLHQGSGMVFVWSMLALAGTGAVMAAVKAERLNLVMGVLTLYLVTTALLTVRRRVQGFHWGDVGAMLVALAVGVYEVGLGFQALNSPGGTIDGVPAAAAFSFGAVALLAALGDARMLAHGIRGARRIARHLWRMCFSLFIASGSFFLGQADVIPEPVRILPLLAIPAFLPLLVMVYWLWRVRRGRAPRGLAGAGAPGARPEAGARPVVGLAG